jgi:hypothetical protein
MLVTIYQTNKPVITFDASPFDTIGSMLDNINKYRGPDAQIQDLYVDAQRTKKAIKTSRLFFNTIFYTLSVAVPSVEPT